MTTKSQRPPRLARIVRPGRLVVSRPQSVPGLAHPLRLTVYLPPGYEETDERFPVAYLFDGQNLFGDEGSYSGGWHLHDHLDARAARGKRVPIVVGIHHGGSSRFQELSPWPVEDPRTEAQGDRLLDWIVGSLGDLVSSDLRVLGGPENTLLGGSSLGGLLALYGFARHPGFFGRALVMSPSLWVNDGAIFAYVARARIWGDPRLYLDCGGREARGYAIEHARWMVRLLVRKGFMAGRHFMWRPDVRGSHNERAWRRRLPKALRFLYG